MFSLSQAGHIASQIWSLLYHSRDRLLLANWLNLQAERTQKKGGMVMCATVLLIMCFIMLVLLVLKAILLWSATHSIHTGISSESFRHTYCLLRRLVIWVTKHLLAPGLVTSGNRARLMFGNRDWLCLKSYRVDTNHWWMDFEMVVLHRGEQPLQSVEVGFFLHTPFFVLNVNENLVVSEYRFTIQLFAI